MSERTIHPKGLLRGKGRKTPPGGHGQWNRHQAIKHRDIVKRLNQLDDGMRSLVRAMHAEIDALSDDSPFMLHIHVAAGCLSLRWRGRDGRRRPLEPCSHPKAQALLLRQGDGRISRFLAQEAHRIEINHQYSLLFHERKRLRLLVKKRRALKVLKKRVFD